MRTPFALAASALLLLSCSQGVPPVDGGGGNGQADLSVPTTPVDMAQPPDLTMASLNIVKFAAIGDTGKGNTGQSQVAAALQTTCMQRGCDFVQLLGDNVYDSGISSTSDPQMQTKFETPYASIMLPFYVVLGNHDYGGDGLGSEFNKGQHQVDYSAVSTKWKLPAAYYHRFDKHVEFIGLDTNMALYDMAGTQANEVRGWLMSSMATWKIAFGHHPYKSNGRHGNAGNYDGIPDVLAIPSGKHVKSFLESAVCGKADVYICGHDHNRQWLMDTCNGTELAVSGAGASTTDLEGSNPTRFERDTLGFLYVVIQDRTLTAEFIDVNGNVEFTRTITK